MHSINDLTTFCRKTTGDVPAKLVGASTTVVGSKMYLFGGRLVSERKMVSDLYVFDMETFNWEKIPISPDDDVPRARYFHSADAWNNKLIIFGGMSNQPDSINPEELCVLNDVRFFDIATRHWLPALQLSPPVSELLLPRARYAHLSSVTADQLFIIGGQDFNNTWLDDVCVYDLVNRTWVQRRDYPRHCGTYRSVAVSSNTIVRFPQEELRTSQAASTLGPAGERFGPGEAASSTTEFTPSESLTHLSFSAPPSEEYPSDIYLYSNYNFTDVKRELEVFSPQPDNGFAIQDKSSAMTGTTFPPGLRFPTGAILGTHLIIAGTYLAHSYQSFSIWVLDLITMTWTRIDAGKAVETGSWFRGSLWAEANKFVIFGNRNGNLVDDYNRRLLSWDHVAVVDLEAFGVYQPPALKLDLTMQELGLAALEERVVADFDIICEDGRRIPCSRKLLEERWPWFLEQRKHFSGNINQALASLPTSPAHIPMPELPGNASSEDPRVDPRLTSRQLVISEPYPIVLALVQYIYTTALVTPLQHAPAVLSQLLLLATNYELDHLEALVKHAMHRALSNSTSVGVYEVATLCNSRSLQIRALKTVMAYTQKRPSRSRGESNGKPPGSSGGSTNGGSGGGGSGGHEPQQLSRPRGTSDARWRTMGSDSGASNSGYSTRPTLTLEHGVVERNNDVRDISTPSSPALIHRSLNSMSRWRSDSVTSNSSINSTLNGNRRYTQPALAQHPVADQAVGPASEKLNHLADLMGVPSTEELQTIVDSHANRSDETLPTSPRIFAIAEEAEQSREGQLTPVPVVNTASSESVMLTPAPTSTSPNPNEDQITPLPILRPRKSQRRPRATSIVSMYTDSEMHELADLLSDFTASDTETPNPKSPTFDRDEPHVEHTLSIPAPEVSPSRSNRTSLSPSVVPSLSASVLTLADSEHSDGADKHDSLLAIDAYHRSRPPRILTDSMQSIPPSLTSSTSNSSLSNSHFTSPATPLTSSNDTYDSDVAVADLDNPDPVLDSRHLGMFSQDHPVKKWPQQRSNISWLSSPTPSPVETSDTPPVTSLTPTPTPTTAPVLAEPTSPPMSPRTPGSTSTFGRLLGLKKDDSHSARKEKEKKEKVKPKTLAKEPVEVYKNSREKKDKETPEEKKARREAQKKERLRKALMAEPSMMGGMMALA